MRSLLACVAAILTVPSPSAAQLGPDSSFTAYARESPTGAFVAVCSQSNSTCALPNATFTREASSGLTDGGVDLRAASSMTVENGPHFSYFVASRALYNDVLFSTGPASSVTFQVMLSGTPAQSSPDLRSNGGGNFAAYAAVNDHVRQHIHTIGSPDPLPLTLTYNLQPMGATSIQWFLSAVSFIERPANVAPGDPWSAWSSADYLSTLSVDYSTATFYSERNGAGADVTSQVTFSFATSTSTVPEPATLALLGTGLLALGGMTAMRRVRTQRRG